MPNTSKPTLRSATLGAVLLASLANLATAQVSWDGGGLNNQWGTNTNWSDDNVPGSSSQVQFESNIAGATISFNSPGVFERQVNGITLLSTQTNALTLASSSSNRLTLTNNGFVTLQSGAGNLSISRLGTTNSATFTTSDASQVISATVEGGGTSGSINIVGSGVARLNLINAGQANRTLNISSGARLELSGDLSLTSGSNNNNVNNLLNGSGTLTSFGSGPREVGFGRKGSGSGSFSGVIQDGTSSVINVTIGINTTSINGAGSSLFTGTQTFSGNNTYTGTTTVNQGTLISTGTTSGQGNYLIRGTTSGTTAANGTFRGTGSIGLASGATFTIGSASQIAGARGQLEAGATADAIGTLSIGTLGNGNSVVFTNGSTWEVDFDNSASDRIDVVGSVSIGATDTLLNLDSLGFTSGLSTYTLLSSTGSISGTFASVFLDGADITGTATSGFTIGGQTYSLVYGANDITLAAIPEPSAFAALAGLFGLGFAATRRRRA